MRIYTAVAVLFAGLLCAAAGCRSMAEYRRERAGNTLKHIEQAKQLDLHTEEAFTLQKCIDEALKNNLEFRIHALEEQVASEFAAAEAMGMLPQLRFDNNFRGRNEPAASSSEKLVEGGRTYGASISEDRYVNYLNIDLMFSTIDFGLAYFNTRQQADRVLMRKFRTERAKQTLVFDVVKVYYKLAAAQRAKKLTDVLLKKCRDRIETLKKNPVIMKRNARGEAKNISPELQTEFLKMERQLKGLDSRLLDMEEVSRGYDHARAAAAMELRSLMGYYPSPSADFVVDESELDKMQSLLLPQGASRRIPGEAEKVTSSVVTPIENLNEVETMEQIAVMMRPELYEIDIQKHINVLECRKTILMMFPNVQLYADWSNSNNSYLYNKSWWELGVRAAYNLLKLPKQVAKWKAYNTQVETEEMRSYAKAIAVMAEIRIAHGNLLNAMDRFEQCRKISATYQEYHEAAVKRMTSVKASDTIEMDVDLIEMASTQKNIDSIVALGSYYVAYYRLLYTMGLRSLDSCKVEELMDELENARVRVLADVAREKKADEKANRDAGAAKAKDEETAEAVKVKRERAALIRDVNAEIDAKIKAEKSGKK